MSYFPQVLLADDVTADDDIDSIFSQLQQIEPPPSLVERIMRSVRNIPLPQGQTEERERLDSPWFWNNVDGLIVRKSRLLPS
ncbi:MAG TPA: hypothetical protein VFB60_03065 [Ktedonobacteraceae bacterium]|nr:hypothetical protein [Ktedonobacteraceae bacterium]